MNAEFSRRTLVAAAGAAASLNMLPQAANANPTSDPHPALRRTLSRIAFGACAHQSKAQPVWDAILETKPDLFVFLGDNVYGDTRDMAELRRCYAQLAEKPGFKRLRDNVPIISVWDDHDFGENDSGGDYPMKAQSRAAFLDFWNEPKDSPRRKRDGVYASYIFGPMGQRVQIILPDLRTHRTSLSTLDLGGMDYKDWAAARQKAGLSVPGPYARNSDANATMLGDAQWAWLEEQFHAPVDVRIFGSSLQVLADFPGWESWINYARDHQRLIDLVRRQRAGGMVFLSGDTHYGELSKLDLNVPYPLWDITSSGLTEVWSDVPPNTNRQGEAVREVNFGTVTIDWAGAATRISLQVRDVKGAVKLQQTVPLEALQIA
ncbi:MAG: alkaline phosphatase family protein [Rhodospirillaceae bacterium]|nr:alkaline phosphatase family protein [Rhodospirillaceae bacterium]